MAIAVIFDMDGVVVDSEKVGLRATNKMFSRFGKQVSVGDTRPFIGAGTRKYVAGLLKKKKIKMGLQEAIEERKRIYEDIIASEGLAARKGCLGLLKKLKKAGIKTGMATSSSHHKIHFNLRSAKIDPRLFSELTSGTRVKRMKPAPDVYLAAARHLGKKPADCIVIEDAEKGVIGAKRAGMKAIGIVGIFDHKMLKKAGADLVVSDAELPTKGLKFILKQI